MRRRLLCIAIIALAGSGAFDAQQQRPFVERVDVSRVLIDVRVVDDSWRPIIGLMPADFAVRIDGVPVRVESSEWIAQSLSATPSAPSSASRSDEAGSRGRLIVLLVQKSLESIRISGLMRLVQLVDPLFSQLTPIDRVALLSFDSHLRIWNDFTGDLDRIRSLLRQDVLLTHPGPVNAASDVSLVARLDPQSAKSVHGIEHALRRIGEALEPLPGAKSIVLLGHGFGRFSPSTGSTILMDGYDEAALALKRARAAVFALNVTQANYNSLQAGLQAVAAETGGFYSSTYEFPKLAVARVTSALEGHYVLFVDKPDVKSGEHRIDVRLTQSKGRVFARTSYVD